MFVIPAVDIKNGKCVQLVQGKPGTEQVIIENPEEVAKEWQDKGANLLHVINLDGAFGDTSANLDVVKKNHWSCFNPSTTWRRHKNQGRCRKTA